MMMMNEMEILDALEAAAVSANARPDEPFVFTAEELAELTNWGLNRVRRVIKQLIATKRVESTQKWKATITGAQCRRPAYRFLRNAS